MALMGALSFSISPVTAVKPQTPSLPHSSSHKPSSSRHSSQSNLQLQAQAIDHFDSSRQRRRSSSGIEFWGKHSAVASPRSAAIVVTMRPEPLKIMISGAPASGKGTQCALISKKYGLVHIAAGDLLRAEIEVGSENGKCAKEYMEKGMLVPDEIVVTIVRERLLQPDAQEKGWLLDGYPRSLSQAQALENLGIRPDLFILLEVSEDTLVERVVGRRLDPFTGKIYHLKYSPPENDEIASRLTQRFDDTEEKVKLRLQTHHQNVEAVLSVYKDILYKVDGNASKEDVFAQIDNALSSLLKGKSDLDFTPAAVKMAS